MNGSGFSGNTKKVDVLSLDLMTATTLNKCEELSDIIVVLFPYGGSVGRSVDRDGDSK